jgi:hypothetical protein
MNRPGAALEALLAREPIPLEELASLLDGLSSEERISAVRAVSGSLQARLFEAAAKNAPLTLFDLVPPDVPDMHPVRHFGRNSLPLFKFFEKRFFRPPGERGAARLFGYNYQKLMWLTGPGFMSAYGGKDGEVRVDYREVPDRVPEGWPAPRPNARGIARLVYGNMVDRLRRVSKHVTIGRAFRGEKPESAWFLLCREG